MTDDWDGHDAAIAWGTAGAALEDNDSGDLHLVARRSGGALLGVIDGLGHGPPAAEASEEAARILMAHADAPHSSSCSRVATKACAAPAAP